MNEDDEYSREYIEKISKKRKKKILITIVIILLVSVLTYQYLFRFTVIGNIDFQNGEWVIIEDENKIYTLILDNESDINLSEFQYEYCVVWGSKLENNTILVDKIKIYIPGSPSPP